MLWNFINCDHLFTIANEKHLTRAADRRSESLYRRYVDFRIRQHDLSENDIEDNLVAPVSLLSEALEKSANIIVPILESLPLEMKRMNPELTGHDIHLVKKAIAESQNVIADMT